MYSLRIPLLLGILALGPVTPALAQITLPQVQLPQLPVQTPDLNRTVGQVVNVTDPDQLRELRRLRVRELLRTNRQVLEADPRGAPIVRSEIVALSPSPEALQSAQDAGFEIARRRALEGLDITMVVLRAPEGMSTRRALRTLQRADPGGVYDFNHLYMESGDAVSTQQQPATPDVGRESPVAPTRLVGLIDGGVDRSHPVFQQSVLHEHGCEPAVPGAHGTAVASLLVAAADFHAAASGVQLYVADVYCGVASGGAVDAVAEAFAWLTRERVPVINVSLVGPANATLEQVIRVVLARGHIVVAAVGNDGPSAPPLFPAAYPGVIGVTAVDARDHVLLEACRGPQVSFAAPGADLSAAALEHNSALVRGTSFAAPVVAGLLAQNVTTPDRANAERAVATLASQAIDLGSRGRDPIYGQGLVGSGLRNKSVALSKE
ncbi:MAG TPA: S8 family serine peptidase [Povalibacter sp.]|nr:S8 family serine peptidase [Povalibacter sp.]